MFLRMKDIKPGMVLRMKSKEECKKIRDIDGIGLISIMPYGKEVKVRSVTNKSFRIEIHPEVIADYAYAPYWFTMSFDNKGKQTNGDIL